MDMTQFKYNGFGGSEIWNRECRDVWAQFAAAALSLIPNSSTANSPFMTAEIADELLQEYITRFAGNKKPDPKQDSLTKKELIS